jgi:hypothetical protein
MSDEYIILTSQIRVVVLQVVPVHLSVLLIYTHDVFSVCRWRRAFRKGG